METSEQKGLRHTERERTKKTAASTSALVFIMWCALCAPSRRELCTSGVVSVQSSALLSQKVALTGHEETSEWLHAECFFFFSCNVSSPSPLSALSETSTVMKESEAEGSSDARHHSRPTSRADVTNPLFFVVVAAVVVPPWPGL